MLNRRQFVVAGTALLAISAFPVLSLAQDAKPVNGGALTGVWRLNPQPSIRN